METIERMTRYVTAWWGGPAHAGEAARFRLAGLVSDVRALFRRDLAGLLAEFDDRKKYPERPMIRIGGACDGDPVLWLLGWRQGDATPIHDHERSEVAIRVLQGCAQERIWWPNAQVTKDVYAKAQRVERELHEASTVTVPTPYIHVLGNWLPPTAATLHAYWPPLDHMRYYEEGPPIEGPCLRLTGRWDDDAGHHVGCGCGHDPKSCGDRGCHQEGCDVAA